NVGITGEVLQAVGDHRGPGVDIITPRLVIVKQKGSGGGQGGDGWYYHEHQMQRMRQNYRFIFHKPETAGQLLLNLLQTIAAGSDFKEGALTEVCRGIQTNEAVFL